MTKEQEEHYGKILSPEIKASVIEMFENLLQVTPQPGDFSLKLVNDFVKDVSGLIKISDENHCCFLVTFDQDSITYFVEKVLGIPQDKIDAVVLDGASEITNMIYGILKKRLAGTGVQWKMCVPEVHIGRVNNDRIKEESQALVIPFSI